MVVQQIVWVSFATPSGGQSSSDKSGMVNLRNQQKHKAQIANLQKICIIFSIFLKVQTHI